MLLPDSQPFASAPANKQKHVLIANEKHLRALKTHTRIILFHFTGPLTSRVCLSPVCVFHCELLRYLSSRSPSTVTRTALKAGSVRRRSWKQLRCRTRRDTEASLCDISASVTSSGGFFGENWQRRLPFSEGGWLARRHRVP